MRKTIMYVGGFELPDKNAAAHRVINNGKIFRELGYDVVYLGISHTCEKIKEETFDGFRYWSIPYPKNKKQWITYLTSIKYIKQYAKKIENLVGIIFYNYQSVALAKGLYFCKKNHLWSMVDVTEWYMAAKQSLFFYIIKKMDTAIRMRVLNKKADGLITISTYLTNYYKKNKCENIIQIPPLIDKQEKKWNISKVVDSSNKIKLVYAGSTDDMKDNLGLVLKNIVDYQDSIEFHVLGMDRASFSRVFENMKDYCMENLVFHGRVSHLECLSWIKSCDFQIFLRPNNRITSAGFPTKLGESFACGIPVITNISSNIEDYVLDGENGFIVSGLTDREIREALQRVSQLTVFEKEKMKQNCRENKEFDYRNYVHNMASFFENLRS